jgi:hypothetical protein
MERKAWHCPGCGKVHAPHVDTCPEPVLAGVSIPTCWPMPDYPYKSPTDATRMPWETQWVSIGGNCTAPRDQVLLQTWRDVTITGAGTA